VAGGVLAVIIRRTLRPLDRLAGEIAELDGQQLSSRLELPATPRELVPVVNRLNELLARLEHAFERERSFSADIAHELRTPIAGLRSALEVAISRPRDAEDYRHTLEESLEIVRRTQNMVQTMLYLCRLDAGQIELEEQPVAVDELVRTSWKPLQDLAAARGLEVDWGLPPAVSVMSDPILLEVAIRNVLENAVVYADERGCVRVQVNGAEGTTSIRVVNSGSVLQQEQVPSLLERFVRADNARDSSRPHCGLGLPIVARIAEILRMSVDIRSRAGGDFEVTLSLENGKPASSS
ncbi:MAG: ATP-binding protein, partial [Planctomycetota bacterium]|jgi:signal transduction histidine kinase